jgi:CRP-like cAMP-binding protein
MAEQRLIIIDILKNLNLFSGLNEQALEVLSRLFNEKNYRKGDVIFLEGSSGNSMMIIVSGDVRISLQSGINNEEETLMVLKKGDQFGEMALLENLPRSADVIAHTDVMILEISRENFLQFINNHPDSGTKILLNLAKNLSVRLREADAKIKTFVNLSFWV